MRIGILTQNYKPERGAAPNRLHEMATGFQRNGTEVYVVTAMPNYPTGKIFSEYKGKFTHTEYIDNIEIKRYWLYASNSHRVLPRIFNMLSFSCISLLSWRYLRKKKLDYLIVQSPPLLVGYFGRFLAKLSKTKFIVNVSDLWPLSAKELGTIKDGWFYHFLEAIEQKMYKSANLILGQSEEIVEYVQKCGFKNTLLFRNGVTTSRFDGLAKTERHSKLRIVYAGLLGYAQGISALCKSINFNELGVEFHIYGQGGEQNEIKKFIENHSERGIFYHGSISPNEIPQLLINCDLTLVPLIKHIYGAVPSKIFESMAAGLPILFLGEGEGVKIITDNNIGLVAGNYNQLIDNIQYLKNNPNVMVAMSQNCLKCAHKKFNRTVQINKLHKLLRKFL